MNNYNSKSEWNTRWDEGKIIASTFEDYKKMMGPIVQDLLDELKNTIAEFKIENKRILDIGGGYGAVLTLIFHKNNEKYLVDLSSSAIEIAKEEYHIKNAFVLDILKDDFVIGEKFDVILLNEVIEHILPVDHEQLLSKIYYLLKSDGLLIVTTPNLASISSRILLLLGKIPVTFRLDKTHVSVFTIKSINLLIEPFGYFKKQLKTTPIRLFGLNFKIPLRLKMGEHIVGVWKKTNKN